MTRSLITAGAAAAALLGGAAFAQPSTTAPAQPGSGYSAPPVGAVTGTATSTQGVTNTPTTTYSATESGTNASVTIQTVTNGPVPDTPQNRKKYGGPMSRAGRHTAARGN